MDKNSDGGAEEKSWRYAGRRAQYKTRKTEQDTETAGEHPTKWAWKRQSGDTLLPSSTQRLSPVEEAQEEGGPAAQTSKASNRRHRGSHSVPTAAEQMTRHGQGTHRSTKTEGGGSEIILFGEAPAGKRVDLTKTTRQSARLKSLKGSGGTELKVKPAPPEQRVNFTAGEAGPSSLPRRPPRRRHGPNQPTEQKSGVSATGAIPHPRLKKSMIARRLLYGRPPEKDETSLLGSSDTSSDYTGSTNVLLPARETKTRSTRLGSTQEGSTSGSEVKYDKPKERHETEPPRRSKRIAEQRHRSKTSPDESAARSDQPGEFEALCSQAAGVHVSPPSTQPSGRGQRRGRRSKPNAPSIKH